MKPYLPYRPYRPYLAGAVAGEVAVLESIAVTPATQTIDDGATLQFTATGTYDDASTADLTALVTWESDDTDVATIDTDGLATGTGPGQATISATLGAISGNTTLDVSAVPLWSRDFTTLDLGDGDTFGRTSAGYHQQPTGSWVSIASGAPRFYGANWTGAAWDKTGASEPYGLLMEPLETNLVASSETVDYIGLTATTAVASIISGVNLSGFITIAASGVHQAYKTAFAPGAGNVPYWARAILKTNGSYNVGCIIVHDGLNSDNARRTVVFFNATTGAYLSSLGVAPLTTESVVQADGSILFAVRVDTLTTSNRAVGIGILPTAQDPIVAWTPDGTSGFYAGNISLTTTEPGSFIVTSGAAASRAIDTLDYTDDELNNETRIVKRLVSDPGTEVIVDIDDWDYTVPAPTVPQFIQRIDVYAPGERPAP